MWVPEVSPVTIAPLLSLLLTYADKFLLFLSQRYKPFLTFRHLLLSSFLLLLRLAPPFFSLPSKHQNDVVFDGDSGIARALTQLLSIIAEIPVSSRKYEVVRCLAERIIEENHREGSDVLSELNRSVLKGAFGRAVRRLEEEAAVAGPGEWGMDRVARAVRAAWTGGVEVGRWEGVSAEKLAAELMWLAQKMVACGFGYEAVRVWAASANLAWLGISAEPRLQGSLLKVTGIIYNLPPPLI